MTETWLKCKYCGHEIHAATLEGDIENHNCKDRQIAALKELYIPCQARMIDLQDAYIKMRQEIAALKAELESESRWAKKYLERLEAWRAVKPLLRYPNWPDSGNKWITDAIEKLKSLGEL